MIRIKIFIVLLFVFAAPYSYAQVQKITANIGTGDIKGGLYPLGISVGKILNMNAKIHGVQPNVTATDGSVYNINAVISGELTIGLAEADTQYRAYNGLGEWEGAPQLELRALFSLTPEYIQLIVSEKSKIKTLMDLKGKKINAGLDGSGAKEDALAVMASYNFDNTTTEISSLSLSDSIPMVQDGRLDGFFITSIYPVAAIEELSSAAKTRLIDIAGADKLLYKYPDYKIGFLPKSAYPRTTNPNDPKTVSVMTTLVTSGKTSNYTAYIIAREIFENIEILRTLHPSLKNIDVKEMLKYNTAPIHPGAMRYFQDKGLLE